MKRFKSDPIVNELSGKFTSPTISDLPLMCLEAIVEAAAAVHEHPLQLREVCKLWQRILLRVYHLRIRVDENDPTLFRVRRMGDRIGENSGPALNLTQLETTTAIGHIRLAELSTRSIEKNALALLNEAAQRQDHIIDLNLDIDLWNFVVENYGEWWTENKIPPLRGNLVEDIFIRNFDVEDALGRLFRTSRLSGGNISEVYPSLRLKSVRFSDVAFDYNATNGLLRRRVLSFLAEGCDTFSSLSLCNKQYYEWLSEFPESLASIMELTVSKIRMTGHDPRNKSKRETFEKVHLSFPEVRQLDFEPLTSTDSLAWIAQLPHLERLRLTLGAESRSWEREDIFPETLPACVRKFHLLTQHSFLSALFLPQPIIRNANVIAACLRMSSTVVEMQLDLYAHLNGFSDVLTGLLSVPKRHHFCDLETLKISGWITNDRISHLLEALKSASPKLVNFSLKFVQKVSDRRCASTLFGDYRYLEILWDLPKSVRVFELCDEMIASTKVVNGIRVPGTLTVSTWLLDVACFIRQRDLRRVAFSFPCLPYAINTKCLAMSICDELLEAVRQREEMSDADLHAVYTPINAASSGMRLSVSVLPDAGVTACSRSYRSRLELAMGRHC